MRYRPEVDGLRAIAVVSVILFHAGFSLFSGGYIGVDIFFVISGYLITTIIISELEKGAFSLIAFYDRRIRRIIPALFVVLLLTFFVAWFWLLPSDMLEFLKSVLAVISFSSNFFFWQQTNYWNIASELKPLLHTWSLAVEEQFYILYPPAIMILWRYKKKLVLPSFLVLSGISLFIAQWAAYNEPVAGFYLLPTRSWELLIGANIAIAFLYHRQLIDKLRSNKLADEILGWVGIWLIGYSVFKFQSTTPFPSAYALLPTLGTGFILLSSSNTMVGRLLGIKPLVGIGLISYSAYLLHQPLFAFARYIAPKELDQYVLLGLVFLNFFLAYFSWKFIENPFRNKEIVSKKNVFRFFAIGIVVLVSVGVAGYLSNGFDQRNAYTRLLVNNYQPDNRVLQMTSWKLLRELSGDSSYGVTDNMYDNQLWFSSGDERQKLLLIGNSHSKDVYNALMYSHDATTYFEVARYGVQIASLSDENHEIYSSPNYQMANIIMIVSQYSETDSDVLEQVARRIIEDEKTLVIVKNTFEFLGNNRKTLADIILVDQKLLFSKQMTPDEIANYINGEYYWQFANNTRDPRIKKSDAVIEEIVKNHNGVFMLDRMAYECDKEIEKCFSINADFDKYFYDYGHTTLAGAAFFGAQIDKAGWLHELIQLAK
jgi:peptidoglycan/LPS O-acetylase OafA/YrhL